MELFLLPKAVLTLAASPHIFESPAMEGRYDIKPLGFAPCMPMLLFSQDIFTCTFPM